MLDLNKRLGADFTFEQLMDAIREDTDFRQALIKSLAEDHPDDFAEHVAVRVGRSQELKLGALRRAKGE